MATQNSPAAAQPAARSSRDLVLGLLLLAAVFVAYFPALQGGPLMDDETLVAKPELRGAGGLGRIWFEVGATQQYYPLLHTAFWLQHQLWGEAMPGYHVVTLLLHVGVAILLVAIMRRLALPGAWLAAFVFALHPVCVESVAWVAEQKNTLSTGFFLGALLVYLRFDDTRERSVYGWATALFVAALLSKTVTATLPPALLVIFWWKRGRLDWRRDVQPLLPWFAAGTAAGLFSAWVERRFIGAEGADFALGFVERGLLAAQALWFYLGKLLWPADLMFKYPRWPIDSGGVREWLAVAGVIGAIALCVWLARIRRGPLAALLLFGGTLFPVLGFLNIYWFVFSYVADHFQYLSMLALLAPCSVALTTAMVHAPAFARLAGAAILIATLGGLTWKQSHLYRDYGTLMRDTLARNPGAWLFHNNLGVDLAREGRIAEATERFKEALRLKPNFAEAHFNLARAYESIPERRDDALAEYREALRLQPRYTDAHFNLGNLLANGGRLPEAIPHFQKAVELRPAFAEAQFNLGNALAETGRLAEALSAFEAAVRQRPEFWQARFHLGMALADTPGRRAEALKQLEEVVRLNPQFEPARQMLAELRIAGAR
jgi:protein O-mannosyl-transferase